MSKGNLNFIVMAWSEYEIGGDLEWGDPLNKDSIRVYRGSGKTSSTSIRFGKKASSFSWEGNKLKISFPDGEIRLYSDTSSYTKV